MTRSICRALAAAGIVLVLATPARANLDRAKELLVQAREAAKDKLWTSLSSLCDRIESELKDVEEGKKAPVAQEVAEMRKVLGARDKSEDEDILKRARYELSTTRKQVDQKNWHVIASHCDGVIKILDEEKDSAKKVVPEATRAEILKKVEEYRKAAETGAVDDKFARVEEKFKDFEDLKGDKQASTYDNKVRWSPDLSKEIDRLPQDDPRTKAMRDRFAKDVAAFEKAGAAAHLDDAIARIERDEMKHLEDQTGEKGSWWYKQKLDKIPEAEEKIAKLPQDDPRVKALKERVAKLKTEYEKGAGSSGREEAMKPVKKEWDETKAKISKESDGFEKCALPPHVAGKLDELDNLSYTSFKKCTDRCYEAERFLKSYAVREAEQKYSGDAELKTMVEAAQKMQAEAASVVCKLVAEAFTRCDAEGEKDHTQSLFKVKNLMRDLGSQWYGKHSPDYAATIAKGQALADKWEGANKAAAAATKEWEAKLTATCEEFWNDATSGIEGEKIDAIEAGKNISAYKGKRVRFKNANNALDYKYWHDGTYHWVIDQQGAPILIVFDQGIVDARNKMQEATGLEMARWPEPIEDMIGVVDSLGRIETQEYSHVTNRHYETGIWFQAPVVRITAVKVTPFALVGGTGTNMSKVKGGPSISCDATGSAAGADGTSGSGGSSSSGGGSWTVFKGTAMRWVGRLLAYWNAFLAFVGGLLAMILGSSGLAAQVGELRTKMGKYLGYAGAGLAGYGALWLLMWGIVGDMLPAGALLMAAGFVSLDMARLKGKIAEDSFTKALPLGIVLGLGAWFFAAIHVIAWDYFLL